MGGGRKDGRVGCRGQICILAEHVGQFVEPRNSRRYGSREGLAPTGSHGIDRGRKL